VESRARLTPEAEQDLRDLAYYIADKSGHPQTARNVVEDITRSCDRYARQPLMGQTFPEAGEGCRQFTHQRWVIVYRPVEEGIEVLRIVDGARDYPRLFG